jgi:hypothetical protein
MKVGIISDTHDNIDAIEKAVKIFDEHKVDLVLHAGDWNAPFALARLAKVKARIVGVFGNIDGDKEALMKKAKEVEARILGEFGMVRLDDLYVAITHGKDEQLVANLIESGKFEVIIRGHAHKPEIKQVGKILVINPGEACGYLTGRKTVAIFDTETRKVNIVPLG